MLYHFDMTRALARNFVVIRQGVYPLYEVRIRIRDINAGEDVLVKKWGEINSPTDYLTVE